MTRLDAQRRIAEGTLTFFDLRVIVAADSRDWSHASRIAAGMTHGHTIATLERGLRRYRDAELVTSPTYDLGRNLRGAKIAMSVLRECA